MKPVALVSQRATQGAGHAAVVVDNENMCIFLLPLAHVSRLIRSPALPIGERKGYNFQVDRFVGGREGPG